MKNLFKRSGNVSSAPTSSGQTIAAALAKATSNTVQPLQQQEMLFLLGASVREPPAMAAAWLDRIISVGKQAEAVLKMLTVLHRLQARVPPQEPPHHRTTAPPLHSLELRTRRSSAQLHSPDFASTLLSSSAHGQTFHAALHELDGRFRDLGKGSRPTSIKTYVVYLRHRLQAPQFVLVAAASAPGTSPQRRQPLGGLHLQLSEWEKIFDLSRRLRGDRRDAADAGADGAAAARRQRRLHRPQRRHVQLARGAL